MVRVLSCFLWFLSLHTAAQEWTFVTKHDLGQRITSSDVGALGKIFCGTERGNVYSFEADGTAYAHYSSAIFQPIVSLDASNSLRVFVYYASTGQFEFLERFSAQSRTYQVDDFGVSDAEYATIGVNQTIWLLRQQELIQINPINNSIIQRLEIPPKLHLDNITSLEFLKSRPLLTDGREGLFLFTLDLSNYVSHTLRGVRKGSSYGASIYALGEGELVEWNPITGRVILLTPPRPDFERVAVSGEYFHFIRGSEIMIYRYAK